MKKKFETEIKEVHGVHRASSKAGSEMPARKSHDMAAISMSGSSAIVAVNALLLKRLRLPRSAAPTAQPASA